MLGVAALVFGLLQLVHGASLSRALNRSRLLLPVSRPHLIRQYSVPANDECRLALDAFKLDKYPHFDEEAVKAKLKEAGSVPRLVVNTMHTMLEHTLGVPNPESFKEEGALKFNFQDLDKMFSRATGRQLLGYAQQVWLSPIAVSPHSYLIKASGVGYENEDVVIKFHSTKFIGQILLMNAWIRHNGMDMGSELRSRLKDAIERIYPFTAKIDVLTYSQEFKKKDKTLDMRPELLRPNTFTSGFGDLIMVMGLSDYCEHTGVSRAEIDALLQADSPLSN